jgi:mercuric ion transport protein
MEVSTKNTWVALGSVAAALGASLCCILPVAVALLGVGSAALGAFFEPFRPYLIAATALLLGAAFYQAYRPEPQCAPGESCAVPASRLRTRRLLWVVAFVALAFLAFPYYIGWIL